MPPWTPARRAERMNPSIIREILKVTELPGVLSLAGGLPSPDSFPVQALRNATARVLRDTPRDLGSRRAVADCFMSGATP